MSKINIDEVVSVLKKNNIDQETTKKVVNELEQIVAEIKADKDPVVKQKNEFVIVLSDPNNELAGKDFTGWVVQMKSGDDVGTLLSRIGDATKAFNNDTRKGRKNPIKTFGDSMLRVARKFFKEKEVLIKTKEPVRVLTTNNLI